MCFAELLTVVAEGDYRLGDHDTKEDEKRLAVEAAKRHALEQVATYVESVTTTTAMDITRDEIRSYTAGVVRVSEQTISTRLNGDQIIIHADLTVQVDPEAASLAVITLRQNDERASAVATADARGGRAASATRPRDHSIGGRHVSRTCIDGDSAASGPPQSSAVR